MKNKNHINKLLHYLYSERDKIESTGDVVDQDLRATYCFINEEIQDLHMMLFKHQYIQFSDRLEHLLECSTGFTTAENGNAV